jgi:hypothetical protein
MTEIDRTVDPFVEAEIKGHNAALIRQMVASGISLHIKINMKTFVFKI